jgi:hypothetical protein
MLSVHWFLPPRVVCEQPGLATAPGVAEARPELPGAVLGLPDGKVHGLLLLTCQSPKIGIVSDPPPAAIDLWDRPAGSREGLADLLDRIIGRRFGVLAKSREAKGYGKKKEREYQETPLLHHRISSSGNYAFHRHVREQSKHVAYRTLKGNLKEG